MPGGNSRQGIDGTSRRMPVTKGPRPTDAEGTPNTQGPGAMRKPKNPGGFQPHPLIPLSDGFIP